MKEVKIHKWMEKVGENGSIVEKESSTIKLLSVLIGSVETMPKGMDTFRTMSRIGKAFDEADESGILKLEEGDYQFLKKTIEGEIPSKWGAHKDIASAIESFLEPEASK